MTSIQFIEYPVSLLQKTKRYTNIILNMVFVPWKIAFYFLILTWLMVYFCGNLGDGQNFIWLFQNIGLYPHQSYVILMSIILTGVFFALFNFLFIGLGKVSQIVAEKLAKTSAGRWIKQHPNLPTSALMVGGVAFVSFILMVNLIGGSSQPMPVLRIPTKPDFPKINRVLLDVNGRMVSGKAKIVQTAKDVYQVRMIY